MQVDPKFVEMLVREVLKQLGTQSPCPKIVTKPNIFVVNIPNDETITWMKSQWNVLNEKGDSLADTPAFQEAVFFQVRQNLIVKGALGLADDRESQVLAELLLKGKTVTMVSAPDMEWLVKKVEKVETTSYYHQQLRAYKIKLESFGVRFVFLEQFLNKKYHAQAHTISGEENLDIFPHKLLTEQGVKDHKDIEIYIRKSTIVTPLARDMAKELGKTILQV